MPRSDYIKFSLAELPLEVAAHLGKLVIRNIKKFFPKKKLIPALFIDDETGRFLKPFREGIKLIKETKTDGLLIDTYNKSIGKGLLDYCSINDIKLFVLECHNIKKEAWIAGSIIPEELSMLWSTGVDVICIRGAAYEQKGKGRFGEVKSKIIADLVKTIPI